MSKKDRQARRDATRMERELTEAQHTIMRQERELAALRSDLRAATEMGHRLSQTLMVTRVTREGQRARVSIDVEDNMLREIRIDPKGIIRCISEQLVYKLRDLEFERQGLNHKPFFAEL